MTFSEYASGLSPYISFGQNEASYFTELIGNFIDDAAMDSCALLMRMPDTKYRYIKGNRLIQPKDAQYLYDHRNMKKFSFWIEERMGDTESYDKIEEWLNENGITTAFVPDTCATLFETVILEIIKPPTSSVNDVQLPREVDSSILETTIGDEILSKADHELLQNFHADYDEIIKLCIGEGYAYAWLAGNISEQIMSLYTEKWETKSVEFQNLMLRSCIIETLGFLQQMRETLNPNIAETAITAFRPSIRSIRLRLRNNYVKLHPDEFVGIFPYETFVPDWEDGEY